jgi:hypothetical protein
VPTALGCRRKFDLQAFGMHVYVFDLVDCVDAFLRRQICRQERSQAMPVVPGEALTKEL